MSNTFSVVVTLVPSKSGKTETSNGKPYRVAKPNNGGSFCIFPKTGDAKAAKIVAALPTSGNVTLQNVGLYEGIIVYGDSVVGK
jgi:hypothetical protein